MSTHFGFSKMFGGNISVTMGRISVFLLMASHALLCFNYASAAAMKDMDKMGMIKDMDKMGMDKMKDMDKMGMDKMGMDKMGMDKMKDMDKMGMDKMKDLDKMGMDKMGMDKMKDMDKMGMDKMGMDKMGMDKMKDMDKMGMDKMKDMDKMGMDKMDKMNKMDDREVCMKVHDCWSGEPFRALDGILRNFRLAEIPANKGKWCPHKDCWDEKCHDNYLKDNVMMTNEIIAWVCINGDGFAKSKACFVDPFPRYVTTCIDHLTGHNPRMEFENCVNSTLKKLSCEKMSEDFTMKFINFIMNLHGM